MPKIISYNPCEGQGYESGRPKKRRKSSNKTQKEECPFSKELIGKIFSYLSFNETCHKFPVLSKGTYELFKEDDNVLHYSRMELSTRLPCKTILKILAILKRMKVKSLWFETPSSENISKDWSRVFTQKEQRLLGELSSLNYLSFSGSSFRSLNFEHLQDLSLTSLKIEDTKLKSYSYQVIGQMKIKRLSFDTTETSDDNLKFLQALPLVFLNLYNNPITDAGVYHLRKMPLTTLKLEETGVEGRTLKYIKSVKKICLCDSRCGDLALEQMKGMNFLDHLCLGSTNISSRGVRSINHLSLSYLNMQDTAIDDAGLLSLRDMPLRELRLTSCREVEGTEESLAALVTLPLKILDISKTGISKTQSKRLARKFKHPISIKV